MEVGHPVKRFITFSSGVLTEICDVQQAGCNLDAKAFKGIFVRNLRYLLDASSSTTSQQSLFQQEIKASKAFLDHNVKAIMANASCVPKQ